VAVVRIAYADRDRRTPPAGIPPAAAPEAAVPDPAAGAEPAVESLPEARAKTAVEGVAAHLPEGTMLLRHCRRGRHGRCAQRGAKRGGGHCFCDSPHCGAPFSSPCPALPVRK